MIHLLQETVNNCVSQRTAPASLFCTVETTRQFGVFILVFDQSSIHCALCMYVCVCVCVSYVSVRVSECERG